MHIHLGAIDFLKFVAYYLIFAFIWQTIAAKLAERPIGRAMAYFL